MGLLPKVTFVHQGFTSTHVSTCNDLNVHQLEQMIEVRAIRIVCAILNRSIHTPSDICSFANKKFKRAVKPRTISNTSAGFVTSTVAKKPPRCFVNTTPLWHGVVLAISCIPRRSVLLTSAALPPQKILCTLVKFPTNGKGDDVINTSDTTSNHHARVNCLQLQSPYCGHRGIRIGSILLTMWVATAGANQAKIRSSKLSTKTNATAFKVRSSSWMVYTR